MKPISSSERKGILTVAAIALLISGAGYCFSRCDRRETPGLQTEAEVLMRPDSTFNDGSGASGSKAARNDSVKKRKKKKKQSRQPKSYRRRSPRDEVVSD